MLMKRYDDRFNKKLATGIGSKIMCCNRFHGDIVWHLCKCRLKIHDSSWVGRHQPLIYGKISIKICVSVIFWLS